VELFVTDGTTAGTRLVKDLAPGSRSSNPVWLAAVGGTLYFQATTTFSADGAELWKSDGTAAGTVLVKNVAPGAYNTSLSELTAVAGRLFFEVTTGNSTVLWTSDGTTTGTLPVGAGTVCANGSKLAVLGTTVLFSGGDCELWSTDGTSTGTSLVRDIFAGTTSSNPSNFTVVGSTVFFAAETQADGIELWKSDGTTAGTQEVADLWPGSTGSSPTNLFVAGSTLYFQASDGVTGSELYRYDTTGTSGAPTLVADVFSGANGSSPRPLATLGSLMLFTASDGTHGSELWRTDGTGANTALVADLVVGPTGSNIEGITSLGSTAVFGADDGTGPKFWTTDGTSVAKLLNLVPTTGGVSFGQPMIAVGASVLFAANDSVTGMELWTSDGTPAGTKLVSDVEPAFPTKSSNANAFTRLGDAGVFFVASDGVAGFDLFRTDGTATGTALVRRPAPPPNDSMVDLLMASGSALYFTATDLDAGLELWTSDGTAAGTRLLCDVEPGPVESSIGWLTPAPGSGAYFSAWTSASGRELWKTDGTTAGTVQVADLEPGTGDSAPQNLAVVGPFLYFSAKTSLTGREPWVSDGTPAGTVQLGNLKAANIDSNPSAFIAALGKVFFVADSANYGRELFSTDGTPAGTRMVKDLVPGSGSPFGSGIPNEDLVELDGGLFFCADDHTGNGAQLWRTDGTAAGTAPLLVVTDAGSSGFVPMKLSRVGDRLLFVAENATTFDLWASDGTAAGTAPFFTVCTKPCVTSQLFNSAKIANGVMIFAIGDSASRTWFRTDGTSAGTAQLRQTAGGDLFKISGGRVAEWNGNLLFGADDGFFDVEPWKLDLSPPQIAGTMTGTIADGGWFVSDVTVSWTESDPQSPITSAACQPMTVTQDTPDGGEVLTCSATSNGGTSTATLVVRRDVTPPTLACPAAPDAGEATSAAGAIVFFDVPTATDVASTPLVWMDRDAGSLFPLGVTTVHAYAQDVGGHVSTCTFDVTVRDTTPPTLDCPKDTVLLNIGPDDPGAVYAYDAGVHDTVDPSPLVVETTPSGSLFPVQTTPVTVTATDASGNVATCMFQVTVTRVTPPLYLTCPVVAAVPATSAAGAPVDFPDPAPHTDVTGIHVDTTVTPGSGSTFPVGDTTVKASARDDRGNTATCEFTVTVTPKPLPVSRYHFGCAALDAEPTGLALAAAALVRALTRRRRR
jgi:ELWxxDGT repeat protein